MRDSKPQRKKYQFKKPAIEEVDSTQQGVPLVDSHDDQQPMVATISVDDLLVPPGATMANSACAGQH